MCGGWSRRGTGWKWKWKWTRGSTGRSCRSSHARTFDDVHWDSTDTFLLRLGVLLLCVPTAMFNWRTLYLY